MSRSEKEIKRSRQRIYLLRLSLFWLPLLLWQTCSLAGFCQPAQDSDATDSGQKQASPASGENAPLKGHIEADTGAGRADKKSKKAKLKPEAPATDAQEHNAKPLPGNVGENALHGQTDQSVDLDPQLVPFSGQAAKPQLDQPGALKGTVQEDAGGLSREDPDAEDRELMIGWDRWRNNFLRAIQSGMQEALNNPENVQLVYDPQRNVMTNKLFPLGTQAWFSCEVTPDKRIVHIKIVHSSGFKSYDNAVLDAIDALQGSSILRYPHGSKRQIVLQVAAIRTAEQSSDPNFQFGDVEHQRIPGN